MERSTFALIVLPFAIAFAVWFYWPKFTYCGVVADKWVESDTSCDSDGDCSTSKKHMIQFEDGSLYVAFWGNRVFDKTLNGKEYCYTMRGRNLSLFGWRIATPAIFDFNPGEGQ